jgi:aminoglycoside phosphotransferase (APT) family kinase protein
MLSRPDADLVARDPALPGLATLLDSTALAELLRRARPEFDQAELQPIYVRYKPGTRCLVAYHFDTCGRRFNVHANAYASSRWAAVSDSAPGEVRLPGPFPIVAHDRALVVKAFPEDATLRVLKRLWDPAARLVLLRKLLPDDHALHAADVETLAYNPERRYVGLLKGVGTQAVIKLYGDGVFGRARAAAVTPYVSGALQTPRSIGRSRRHRAVVFEWLPGERLSDLLAIPRIDIERFQQVGAALAELHRQLRHCTIGPATSPAEHILRAARAMSALSPHLLDRADRLALTIVRALEANPARQPIHGDFYAAQILVGADRVGILDLDRVDSGDPVSDLGNFVAHLEYATIDGHLSPEAKDIAADALISGYEQAARVSVRDRIPLHVAAGLLRLVARPFRARATEWDDRMATILDRVDRQTSQHPVSPSRHADVRGSIDGSFDAVSDREIGLNVDALDCTLAARHFAQLPRWHDSKALQVSAVRLIRHKPGRHCLIEYDVKVETANGVSDRFTVIGKVKRKGADRHTFELSRALRLRGFDDGSRISVPEPIGVLPEWKMWVQRKVEGIVATHLLDRDGAQAVGRRAAEVIHKLQRAGVAPVKSHTADDELRVLRERLAEVAGERLDWAPRLETLFEGCRALLASVPHLAPCAVHRDFHPGQLIIDGDRVHLLDLDLYARGDPALDAGNFLAHITEYSLRAFGDPDRLGACELAMVERLLELEPSRDRRRLQAYRLVSLARHVYISTRFPDRQAFTQRILEYCEEQLALVSRDESSRSDFRLVVTDGMAIGDAKKTKTNAVDRCDVTGIGDVRTCVD